MTAVEIISEIRNLAPGEKARVLSFVRELDRGPQLDGRGLTGLAEEFAQARDPAEVEQLRACIVAGFYGEERPRA